MKKLLLDTNAFARLGLGDASVVEALGNAEVVYLSVFVLGELLAGFAGGKKEQANRKLLRDFMALSTVKLLYATEDTAEAFAVVKDALKRQGTPLPVNDVWIAAHALETGATLVTFDGHFKHIKGVRLWPGA